MTITGPAIHKGLSLYFIHGTSRGGAVPLTLQEALAKGTIVVEETQNINELTLENLGPEEVFIQAGDVVKGGFQDRVLSVSMLVAAKSGKMPIASFCVESGRWARRAREDAARFSESSVSYSPRRAKMAMADMAASYEPSARRYRSMNARSSQGEIWSSVAETQDRLEAQLSAPVRSALSPSSLQLAMESDHVKAARDDYLAGLEAVGRARPDTIGVIFAINGRVHSAESYPWSGLFAKMWRKNLEARVAEAVGETQDAIAQPPAPDAAQGFLADAEGGEETQHPLPAGAELRQRRGRHVLLQEARREGGEWVHRSYIPA